MIQNPERSEIDPKYKWNLTDLYASEEIWKKEKEGLQAKISDLEQFSGRLSSSATDMSLALSMLFDFNKAFTKLYCYANMLSDQDTRDSKAMAMSQEMMAIGSQLSSLSSFIEPEILTMSRDTLESFIKIEPGLAPYAFYLRDTIRRQTHTGSAGEEKIIAEAGLLSDAPHSIYSVFSNADFPFPEVTLADGSLVKLDHANFAYCRSLSHRGDRKKIFESFLGKLYDYRRTFGAQLYAELKKSVFYKNVRKYDSNLQNALDSNGIETEVYHNHIRQLRSHLPSFHRYLKLRAQILKVDQLHYYDLYTPLLKDVEKKFTVEESGDFLVEALSPLGSGYVDVVKKALSEHWIDMMPNEGKRSGAYSNGAAYDVHPYILMNFKGQYDDMSTMMHELGHTMHSYLSNKTQPFSMAQYSIFVAEVASTFNEALLMESMLKKFPDPAIQLSLLGHYLEGVKGTLFRQTQFAEFELRINELVEAGEALTGDRFSEIYLSITRDYYGHEQGVCIVDDFVQSEWAYIPHFYYNFYVYQYATSFTASAALSEKILSGDEATTKNYLKMLRSGGSEYPLQLLRGAGVDMTSPGPMNLTIQKMNRVMDRIEQLLEKLN